MIPGARFVLLLFALLISVMLSGCLFGGSDDDPPPAPAAPPAAPATSGPLTGSQEGSLRTTLLMPGGAGPCAA